MATKSNNTQGNPYHDEATGEFTSANGGGGKTGELETEAKTNLPQPETANSPKLKTLKFKLRGNIEDIRHNLQKSKQVSSIPFLVSAHDIEEHLEEFFPEEIINNIDSKFGKFSVPYKYFNKRTDPDERCGVNIFAACIGKKRWANNYLKLINFDEYNRLASLPQCKKLFRGIDADYDTAQTIMDSYSSKENEMIYGSVGGTAYGIAVYSSSSWSEANGYASSSRNIMNLILDRNARTMPLSTIRRIRDALTYNRANIVSRVEQIFLNHGIEQSRAKQMATSFGITIGDEGFVAMLCGVEWYTGAGTYYMIENLGALSRYKG